MKEYCWVGVKHGVITLRLGQQMAGGEEEPQCHACTCGPGECGGELGAAEGAGVLAVDFCRKLGRGVMHVIRTAYERLTTPDSPTDRFIGRIAMNGAPDLGGTAVTNYYGATRASRDQQ